MNMSGTEMPGKGSGRAQLGKGTRMPQSVLFPDGGQKAEGRECIQVDGWMEGRMAIDTPDCFKNLWRLGNEKRSLF